jgi:hypothetical protein
MPFAVSFQKMDPNLDVIIIGANFSYVAADVASPRGRRPRSWGRPPEACHIGCHVGKVGANYVGATMCYLGANDDGAEIRVHFLK